MINQKLFFTQQVISHSDQMYLSAYHFIKMLNRPVDLPLRVIVVCVTEPLTFKRETDISTQLDIVMARLCANQKLHF